MKESTGQRVGLSRPVFKIISKESMKEKNLNLLTFDMQSTGQTVELKKKTQKK